MSKSTSPWVIDVAEADFEQQVVRHSHERPVVVDFWASWCRPCLMLGPVLEKVVAERGGAVVLAKVDVDQAPGLAERFAVQSIPAVKAFRDGKVVAEFVGVYPEAQLRQFLDAVLPTEADRQTTQAASVETADPAQAEALYRRALDQDPHQGEALVGLARVLIAQGKDTEAGELLGRVGLTGELAAETERLNAVLELRRLAREFDSEAALRQRLQADPENAQVRYQLGVVLAAAGRYPEALEMLLSAAERDRKLAASQVREAMVKVFYAVGVRSPLADEYRGKLSRLLY
jgi:putative thioredoxin